MLSRSWNRLRPLPLAIFCWSPAATCANPQIRSAGQPRQRWRKQLTDALSAEGFTLRRAHPYREDLQHGFIYNQRMGMDVFVKIHPDAPIIVAEAVWQYSHNVFSGLQHHRGPILTVANWSGQWPGLVGMLNLNGCLHKGGVTVQHLVEQGLQGSILPQRSAAMAEGSYGRTGCEPRARPRPGWAAAGGERVGRVAGPRSQDAQGYPWRFR